MKLTDEQILEMAEERMDYDDNGSFTPGDSQVVDFARAIEATCWPKWLPIEKAPRDGTEVLLRKGGSGISIGFCNMTDRDGDMGGAVGWWIDNRNYWFTNITGWMPLPEAE